MRHTNTRGQALHFARQGVQVVTLAAALDGSGPAGSLKLSLPCKQLVEAPLEKNNLRVLFKQSVGRWKRISFGVTVDDGADDKVVERLLNSTVMHLLTFSSIERAERTEVLRSRTSAACSSSTSLLFSRSSAASRALVSVCVVNTRNQFDESILACDQGSSCMPAPGLTNSKSKQL
jgi:hypothetical protein